MISKRTASAGLLIAIVLLAGCATLSVRSDVGADGTIEEYQLELETPQQVYTLLNDQAKSNGYDSFRDSLLSNVSNESIENVESNLNRSGRNATLSITLEGYTPPNNTSIIINKSNGTMEYSDRQFINESLDTGQEDNSTSINVNYQLEMPGKIKNSTSNNVSGNTATWNGTYESLSDTPIYAKSEVSESSSAFGPGLGIGAAVAALLTVGSVAYRYRS